MTGSKLREASCGTMIQNSPILGHRKSHFNTTDKKVAQYLRPDPWLLQTTVCMDAELRMPVCGCRAAGAGLLVPGCGCRLVGAGLRVPGCGCRAAGFGRLRYGIEDNIKTNKSESESGISRLNRLGTRPFSILCPPLPPPSPFPPHPLPHPFP